MAPFAAVGSENFVTFSKHSTQMQLASLCRCLLLALCLVGDAFASVGSFTYYSDSSCATPLGSTVNGAPNPLIGPSGDCFLGYDVPGSTKPWEKVRTCSSTTSITLYTDASCTTLYSPQPVGNPFPVGTCLTTNLPPGVTSYNITCAVSATPSKSSAASAVPVALFVAVAALFTLCI